MYSEKDRQVLNRDPIADPRALPRNVRLAIGAFVDDVPQFDDITVPDLHCKPSGGTGAYQQTLAKCRRVTPEGIRQEKLSYKIAGRLAQFIAPLM